MLPEAASPQAEHPAKAGYFSGFHKLNINTMISLFWQQFKNICLTVGPEESLENLEKMKICAL